MARPPILLHRLLDLGNGRVTIKQHEITEETWERILHVLVHVSRGSSFAYVGRYPDAAARRALGALHEAGFVPTAPDVEAP
jgi:hypothetical protein